MTKKVIKFWGKKLHPRENPDHAYALIVLLNPDTVAKPEQNETFQAVNVIMSMCNKTSRPRTTVLDPPLVQRLCRQLWHSCVSQWRQVTRVIVIAYMYVIASRDCLDSVLFLDRLMVLLVLHIVFPFCYVRYNNVQYNADIRSKLTVFTQV